MKIEIGVVIIIDLKLYHYKWDICFHVYICLRVPSVEVESKSTVYSTQHLVAPFLFSFRGTLC
jgi:hypothetical protein